MARLIVNPSIHHLAADFAGPTVFRFTVPESLESVAIHVGLINAAHHADIANLWSRQALHGVLGALSLVLDNLAANKVTEWVNVLCFSVVQTSPFRSGTGDLCSL